MELPQPRGRKPTHYFLSLYNHSSVQQDPRPPSQGRDIKTHDFLEPLERVSKAGAKEETSSIDTSASEKPPPSAPLDQDVLLRGTGPYTISHISYFSQRVPKAEASPMFTVAQAGSSERNADENSNFSSNAGSGFASWEESAGKTGQTRKQINVVQRSHIRADNAGTKMGPWAASERPSESFSSSQTSGQKSQSFMEMIRSAKSSTQDDELDDDEVFVMKKESSPTTQIMDLRVKEDRKTIGHDQKPNTPRSKHSATEQRRRSKINDRFQTLRQLIPNSDQKRDKASFLLEVIEYIQFLLEKLNKHEGSCQGWNHEPGKLINWQNSQRPAENYIDRPRCIDGGASPSLVFGPKFDEKNIPTPQTILANTQSRVQKRDMADKSTMLFPLSLQPNLFSPIPSGNTVSENSKANAISRTQAQSCPDQSHNTDVPVRGEELKEQDPVVEGGTISISSVYSQGLLKTLKQALQSSGVDLSQARISVQIELGKRPKDDITSSLSTDKDNAAAPDYQHATPSEPNRKRLKTVRH